MEPSHARCVAIVVCLLALCGRVKADHTQEAAYVLGGVICFMFFVFVFATAERFCSGKYTTSTSYQPLKNEKTSYVPPEAPSSHTPLPSSHIAPAHVEPHHTNAHHIELHHVPQHVPPHVPHHINHDPHNVHIDAHMNMNGHHMNGHHHVDSHHVQQHVPSHIARGAHVLPSHIEKPPKTLGPAPGPPPHTIASTYSRPMRRSKPEIDDIPPPPSSPPHNAIAEGPGSPPLGPSHILL